MGFRKIVRSRDGKFIIKLSRKDNKAIRASSKLTVKQNISEDIQ